MSCSKLKEISFSKTDAMIISVRPSRVLIRWDISKTTQNISTLQFKIERATDPTGFETIAEKLTFNLREFVDYSAILLDIQKVYYYRITAQEVHHGVVLQEIVSNVVSFDNDLDCYANYIVEEHLFKHRYIDGTPVVIFQKYQEGPRCECWDTVLKRTKISHCSICKGTGYVSGYNPPIEAWMDFAPDVLQSQIADWGEKQASQTDIMFTNYPQLNLGDIIVEVKAHVFWRVTYSKHLAEKNRATLLQTARLDIVNRSDVEYELEIPIEMRDHLLKELSDRSKKREF